MNIFSCQACDALVYFENIQCISCGHTLGFLPEDLQLSALEQNADGTWRALAKPETAYHMCTNYVQHAVCNWMIPVETKTNFCTACELNRTIPNLSNQANHTLWQLMEIAKRRAIYGLLRLGLPVTAKVNDDDAGLAFDFLQAVPNDDGETKAVVTGHDNGLITLNLDEADDAMRESVRQNMGERYRTLLGHFRHELGHYYWDCLIADSDHLGAYRELFGNESDDYANALKRHYEQGPPADWQQHFVSQYASAHSWEDWAESWAHYMHLIDTLETASAFGLKVDPRPVKHDRLRSEPSVDAYLEPDFDAIIAQWLPITHALNSLNRSMGQRDAYPFVIAPPVMNKLRFIHSLLGQHRAHSTF